MHSVPNLSSQAAEDEIMPTAAYAIISNPGIRATTVAKWPDNGVCNVAAGAHEPPIELNSGNRRFGQSVGVAIDRRGAEPYKYLIERDVIENMRARLCRWSVPIIARLTKMMGFAKSSTNLRTSRTRPRAGRQRRPAC
jgi:hypothetical protein